jgi:predicted DNA binding protein
LEPSERVRVCRLREGLPDSAWVAPFSREHPDVVIEILNRSDLDRTRSLTEVRLHVPSPGVWMEEVRALPLVDELEPLAMESSRLHFRVVHRTSKFVPVFRELRLERRFPFTIRAGDASWVVVGSEPKIRALVERLRTLAPEVILESVRHTDLHQPAGPLTPRQADLLHRAINAGYFEIPRKVSLTELAMSLGVAPSTLSESLALVEKKLVEHWPEASLLSRSPSVP